MSAVVFNPNGARVPSTPTRARASLKRSLTMPAPSTPSTPTKKRKTSVDEIDSEGNKENIAPAYLGLITPTKRLRRPSTRKSTSTPTSKRPASLSIPSTPALSRRSSFTFSPTSLEDKLADAAALDAFDFDFSVKSDSSDSTPPSSP